MAEARCLVCGRVLSAGSRAMYCRDLHRWRGWKARAQAQAEQSQNLPLALLPEGTDTILPPGGERLLVATRLALIGKAPAGAVGYRVGIKHGRSKLVLWFPAVRFYPQAMFLLEPFEWPTVPVPGAYAVVYMNLQGKPIGGPCFKIGIDEVDKRLRYSDGDRTYKPRPRL